MNPANRDFVLEIIGEVRQAYVVTTKPTALASIYANNRINDGDSSTVHRLTILLRASQEETTPQNLQPVRVLVLNAGGIQNPDFPQVFYELCEQHDPQFALVTETRLGGPQA
ncbi:cc-nbs-lrr resistance protein [Corchorus olitorius]|uniref:Cc-nbs-lrr resistance protein n=1 Tax=Corchorus olitorius TaxID=93759 RepID=A0A1R3KR29_9ROSI|nr:cc-nbs-lrr resistance protein [Corchorus olitorius]